MKDQKEQRTEIAELGEFGLIKVLTQGVNDTLDSTVKGIGDDAAVLDFDGYQTVLSTDLLVEGVHFDMMYTPLKHLGYKAVMVNLSDIYAMYAEPTQVTVSLAISNRFSVEALEEIYSGIQLACERYNVDLVGGDTTSSLSGLMISVTALGKVKKGEAVYRDTAKVGDLICVSGDLGAAYLGLQLLEREKQVFLENPEMEPELEKHQYLVERQLKPEARKGVIDVLKERKVKPTAMIDVSDGLSSDLLHICTQSEVGARIFEGDVPISEEAYNQAVAFNIDPITCALNGGEDYELLFTISPDDKEKIQDVLDLAHIGEIVAKSEGYKLHTKQGNQYDLTAQGWDALLKANEKR